MEIKSINYKTDDPLKILSILPLNFRKEMFTDESIYNKIYDYVKQHENNDSIKITKFQILPEKDKYKIFYHYFNRIKNQNIDKTIEIPVNNIKKYKETIDVIYKYLKQNYPEKENLIINKYNKLLGDDGYFEVFITYFDKKKNENNYEIEHVRIVDLYDYL